MKKCLVLTLFIFCVAFLAAAQGLLDVESGLVVGGGYNQIRVPGNGGTPFDLTKGGFNTRPVWFYRVRAGYAFADRHTLSLLYAPLSVTSRAASLTEPINFNRTVFNAGRRVDVRYTFNSYRLTYRFDFIRKDRIRFGVGLTAKIRDAAIQLNNGERETIKTNVGFVPLVNFLLDWRFLENLGLLLEGDALAAPQGRAEDVFAGLRYQLGDAFSLKAGYRILEGGANNDEVYNFTLFNYAAVGVIWRW